jgi:small GTP-binding protein
MQGRKDTSVAEIKRKICMLGAFSVGKTSLVGQFVHSMFSEKYLTTVGVKIDKKTIPVEEDEVTFLIWDLHGEDKVQSVREAYLRGCAGYILVADGTRKYTLTVAEQIREKVESLVGTIPSILLLNKSDLMDEWEVTDEDATALRDKGWTVMNSSAKTGESVEEVFLLLAQKLIGS